MAQRVDPPVEPEDPLDRVIRIKEELTVELHAVIKARLLKEDAYTQETVMLLMHEQFRFWRNFNPGSEW